MRRPQLAAATFVVGLLLVLLVEVPAARIIGIPLMLLGIGLGITAIASPDFLERAIANRLHLTSSLSKLSVKCQPTNSA
jgi:disulfide bond formation protein DsbB